jgi:hypothetical protein
MPRTSSDRFLSIALQTIGSTTRAEQVDSACESAPNDSKLSLLALQMHMQMQTRMQFFE